ncbi:MAG: hypothetical protein ACLQFR_13740 [Streptosporangiaceae bacterium]
MTAFQEANGVWVAPGVAALDLGNDAEVNSVSCPPATNCVAAGTHTDANGHTQVFVGGTK